MTYDELKKITEQIDNLEDITDMIVIRKGATNGEVIQAVFPKSAKVSTTDEFIYAENLDAVFAHEFYKDWWDAPYNGGEQNE